MKTDHSTPLEVYNLIVVEASNYCRCHTTIRARKGDCPHWFIFLVDNKYQIKFGDHLQLIVDHSTNPGPMRLFSVEGPLAQNPRPIVLEDLSSDILSLVMGGLEDFVPLDDEEEQS